MFELFKIIQSLTEDKRREAESKRNNIDEYGWAYLGGELHTLEATLKLIRQRVADQAYEMDKLLEQNV